MVSIQQTQQQLRQRRQKIEQTQEQIESFPVKIKIPQRLLRMKDKLGISSRDSPLMRREKIRQLYQKRGEAKRQSEQQLQSVILEQTKIEKKFKEFLKTPAGRLQWARENLTMEEIKRGQPIKSGFSVALTKPDVEGKFKTGFTKVVIGHEVKTPYGKVTVPLSEAEASSQIRLAGSSLKQKQLGIISETLKAQKLDVQDLKSIEVGEGKGFKIIEEKDLPKGAVISEERGLPPRELGNVIKLPTGGEKIRGEFRKLADINIPSGIQIIEKVIEEVKAAPGTLVRISEEFPKFIGEQYTDMGKYIKSKKLGAETLAPISIEGVKGLVGEEFQGRPFISEERGFPKVEEIKLVKLPTWGERIRGEIRMATGFKIPGFRQQKEQSKEVLETFGLDTVGGVVKTGVELGQYAIPGYGVALLGSQAVEGAKAFKQPIPTVNEVILQQTPEFTPTERKAFLKTDEGKKFERDIKDYVDRLKKGRAVSMIGGGIALGFLAVPVVGRGIRYIRKPIITPGIIPKPIPKPSKAIVFTTGEEAIGVKAGEIYTPPWKGTVDTKLKKAVRSIWYETPKLKPKEIILAKERTDIVAQAFKIKDGKGISLGVEKIDGKGELQKFFQTTEVQKPIKIVDLSKLPKVERYVASGLPPREISKGVETYIGVGRTFKGIGEGVAPKVSVGKKVIVDFPARTLRVSKTGKQIFFPTRAPTLKEAPLSLIVSRVKPLGSAKGVQVFVTEQAVKSTKAFKPRAVGELTKEQTIVFVKEISKPGETVGKFIGTKLKTKTKFDSQKLAARVSQIPIIKPKPSFPKPKTPEILITEYPKIGISKAAPVSQYYGTGLYERTEEGQILTPVINRVQVIGLSAGLLSDIRSAGLLSDIRSAGLLSDIRLKTRLEGRLLEKVKMIPALDVKPSAIIKVRVDQGVIQTQGLGLRLGQVTRQIQKPVVKSAIGRPSRPSRPKRPRGPRKPGFIKKPKGLFPKEKKKLKRLKEEELVTPFVRRYGKLIPISRPLTKEKAIKKGIARLRTRLAASLQLRKQGGEIIPFKKETKEFRIGREGTLVQRAKRRLKGRGEVSEIISTRKTGVKFI